MGYTTCSLFVRYDSDCWQLLLPPLLTLVADSKRRKSVVGRSLPCPDGIVTIRRNIFMWIAVRNCQNENIYIESERDTFKVANHVKKNIEFPIFETESIQSLFKKIYRNIWHCHHVGRRKFKENLNFLTVKNEVK